MDFHIGKYQFQNKEELNQRLTSFPLEEIQELPEGFLVRFTRTLSETEIIEFMEILVPPNQDELDKRALIQEYKDEYQSAVNRLTQIVNADPGSITQAQAVAAIQDMALYQMRLLKVLRRMVI